MVQAREWNGGDLEAVGGKMRRNGKQCRRDLEAQVGGCVLFIAYGVGRLRMFSWKRIMVGDAQSVLEEKYCMERQSCWRLGGLGGVVAVMEETTRPGQLSQVQATH